MSGPGWRPIPASSSGNANRPADERHSSAFAWGEGYRTVTVKRVHEITTMSVDWIYRKAKAGALPFARPIGRKWVFSAAGLAKWLASRRPR